MDNGGLKFLTGLLSEYSSLLSHSPVSPESDCIFKATNLSEVLNPPMRFTRIAPYPFPLHPRPKTQNVQNTLHLPNAVRLPNALRLPTALHLPNALCSNSHTTATVSLASE
ncbi:hypothetical protein BC936DRAFT_141007 [Jimgerdemannia flammicorona]|uniref:Uncharacterized protein n=1 Tax=Jimgerdemannia flammicorona TaxID=994334 RepID=A0A433A321_9FUNG|nr:hypothetical protein BC936DRAFT_141007 [Jimgerdemannia flammicorona]